jgi:hypothetical protein
MRQQALDHAATGVRIEDAITLNVEFPIFVESDLIVGGILAGRLNSLDEEGCRGLLIRRVFQPAFGCRKLSSRARL